MRVCGCDGDTRTRQGACPCHFEGGASRCCGAADHTDGSAFLAGILWGSSTNLTTGAVQFIFSPLGAVESELGELTTIAPEETTTKKNRRKNVR